MKSEAVMHVVPQFAILLLTVGLSHGQYKMCPPPEDISPCTCGKSTFGRVNEEVVCKMVDDVAQVRRALQSVRGIRGVTVEFLSCSLGLVPSDLFKGLHITELSFTNCNLKGIGNEGRSALEGLENTIEVFWVTNTEGNGLRFLNVTGLHKLERLYLNYNEMKEFGNEWFAEGPANLKNFEVYGNEIERLGDRAFAQLTNIRELWLGHNKLGTLERTVFPSPAVRLRTLHLTDTEISSLPGDIFSEMPALKIVFLGGNSLQRIAIATWTPVWSQLQILSLEDNPLICDSYIEWTFQQRRPEDLTGKCDSPLERKGMDLERLIDNRRDGKLRRSLSTRLFLKRITKRFLSKFVNSSFRNSDNVE